MQNISIVAHKLRLTWAKKTSLRLKVTKKKIQKDAKNRKHSEKTIGRSYSHNIQ